MRYTVRVARVYSTIAQVDKQLFSRIKHAMPENDV